MTWSRKCVLLAALILAAVAPSQLLSQKKDSARVAAGQPSIASKQLTRDAWQMIELLETAAHRPEGCKDKPKLGNRVIAESPKDWDPSKNSWVEHWTVKFCERQATYRAEFTPDPKGGTQFGVRLLSPS